MRYTLSTGGTVTGGSFTIRVATGPSGGGQTYDATIAFNATAAQVKAALESLPNLKDGAVAVAGGPMPGTPMTLQFEGMLKGAPRAVTIGANNLTGTAPTVAIAEDLTGRLDLPGRNDSGRVLTQPSAGAWGNP